MLEKDKIQKLAGNMIYTRGLSIYRSKNILKFTVDEQGAFDCLNAVVQGSGRNLYEVTVVYNVEEDHLEEIDCECPAFYTYSGICKHCTAVLLQYEAYVSQRNSAADDTHKNETRWAKLQSLKGAYPRQKMPQKPQTTPEFKALLAKRQLTRALPILEEEQFEKVRLEPYFSWTAYDFDVEFKIGISHMYIVKDLFSFHQAMENKETVSYGKKLAFVHSEQLFTPESRAMIRFIKSWVSRNRPRYVQPSFYSYNSLPKLRNITLHGNEIEEFMDAMEGFAALGEVEGMAEKTWHIIHEQPPRKMEITGQSEGIRVDLEPMPGLQCPKTYFYFNMGRIYRIPGETLAAISDFLKVMEEFGRQGVFIESNDIPIFCRELLPELEKHFTCTKIDFNQDDYGIIPVVFEIYLDMPQEDFITCRVMAVYGEKAYSIYGGKDDMERRDLAREIEVGKIVANYCNAFDEQGGVMVLTGDEEKLYELVTSGIARMQQLGEVYVSDALKKVKASSLSKVSIGVSLSSNLLEFNIQSETMSKEQLIEILSKYNRKKKYYRLKNGEFINMEDQGTKALLELRDGLCLTDKQLKQEVVVLPKYRALYLDAELRESNALPMVKDKSFKALIRNMKTAEDNDFDIPEAADAILREYQKNGFLWLKTLMHNGFGGILADDMGLGKTLQVIALLQSEFQKENDQEAKRVLIVSPASLVFNWNSEIQKFAPELPVRMVIGTAAERKAAIEGAGERVVLLTSYDLLKRDSTYYSDLSFAIQVIDEAQYIKNHNTQAAKAVKKVHAGFKLALTGTPVENRLSELWSIFDYLMPGFLFSYKKFREEFELPIVQNQEQNAMNRLRKMIRPFVLRRLKKDVLTDLPDKLEKNYFTELEGEQKKLYSAHTERLKLMLDKTSDEEFKSSKIQILAELTKLRQLCCDPGLLYEDYHEESVKTQMCLELIKNAVDGGHKILLFSQFTSMLGRIEQGLEDANISYFTLTGATGKEKRAKMVERFNQDDTPVFCISLKAGGTGLNLTAADIVIHFDPWWNQAVQNQATDRAHRIGQKNVVTVYKLIVKSTIEEKILLLQEKKGELAEQILGGEGMDRVRFTKEELMELLG